MRNVWIVVASALLAFANFVKSQETSRNLYSSRVFSRLYRYDNLDIDTILASSRLVNNYVDCLLSRKPCPPEGKDLKRILPEALRTKCGRCSETQKENALKIITTLYSNYPQQYQALRNRWDPSGEYHRRFEEYLRGLQFNQIGSNSNGGNAGVNTNAIDTPLPSVGSVNSRFGDDESNNGAVTPTVPGTTPAPAPSPITARPQPQATTRPVVRQTTSRVVTQRTTQARPGGGASVNNVNNGSPFVGLFNQIGTKLATTADAIAGMLRKTVDVIVTSHIQAHKRSLRSN
ncbi:uncharacterized protein LOC128743546 isoform X3 [Sabethes cyaneus]|uniref:uncharacterized protein LOC128743546 isoform X3 n=1 Tax=Sabethes cyaneus TaxID=53552 RepID=UPI00237D3940|nr:uncharacterized protein LOC128743546 isoform X3 [Sabethes cyaneus]